ncbi:hypothetical protein ES705_28910 [subsurface metagenome]
MAVGAALCSKIALGVPMALTFDFGLKVKILYRACYLLSHRCEDVLSGHKRTVFNDPSIDKRFSSALDFAALRMVGGYYRPPFFFVGWNLCKVSEFFERKRCRVALLQRSAPGLPWPAISALQSNAEKKQYGL